MAIENTRGSDRSERRALGRGLQVARARIRPRFPTAKRLSHEVASHLVERAQLRIEQGQSSAGWQDVEKAAHLGGCDEQIATLREDQTTRGLDRVKQLLICGETTLAREQIARLEKRKLGGDQRRAWKLIVNLIARARKLSHQGDITAAVDMLKKALQILPDPNDSLATEIRLQQAELEESANKLRDQTVELHKAVAAEDWTQVLRSAEALLELAPEHQAARKARNRAWKAVGMGATLAYQGTPFRPAKKIQSKISTNAWAKSAKTDTTNIRSRLNKNMTGKRLVAWIDEVGGFLICLGEEVVLGQPSVDGADIPLLADLSRQHATIRREGESYVLTPIHQVSIDGQRLAGPTVLTEGAQIELGGSVKMKFQKPHALSATAVLTTRITP